MGVLSRLFLTIILCMTSPLFAYFSKEVQLDGLRYRVHALLDLPCQFKLDNALIADLDKSLEIPAEQDFQIFRGCFFARFDVEVQTPGLYSFVNNGHVLEMALQADGGLTPLKTYYENDSVVADVELKPGHHRIYSSGYNLGSKAANRWGLGTAHYRVEDSQSYHRNSFITATFRGLCLGVLGIMALFFLFFTRESNRVFLIYGSFILANILYLESNRSLVAELLGIRGGPYAFSSWSTVVLVFGTLTQVLACIFFISFYEIKTEHPRLYKALRWLLWLMALEIPVVIFNVPYRYVYCSTVILIGSVLVELIAIWFSAKRGGIYHLVLLGYTVILSCGQYYVLALYGMIEPNNLWGQDVHLIGSTIEVFLFSIATSRKLNHAYAVQRKEKEHVLSQLEKIVYPHQLERIRHGASLEHTMPTGKGEGCVLSFDIIGSSRIQHERVQDFINQVIEQCVFAMHERYDASALTADAYRIKVVGDGFLCSIGFPFGTPDGQSPVDAAVSLALRMVKTFKAVEREFNYQEPIHCAIGLAFGPLEAFYPKVGTKEYDLFGSTIVLATRYEQLRKQLPDPENSDFIILQEDFYKVLSAEWKPLFSCIELVERRIRVRDDNGARRAYIWRSSDQVELERVERQ